MSCGKAAAGWMELLLGFALKDQALAQIVHAGRARSPLRAANGQDRAARPHPGAQGTARPTLLTVAVWIVVRFPRLSDISKPSFPPRTAKLPAPYCSQTCTSLSREPHRSLAVVPSNPGLKWRLDKAQ